MGLSLMGALVSSVMYRAPGRPIRRFAPSGWHRSCAETSIDENGKDTKLAARLSRGSSREPIWKPLRDIASYRRLDTVSKAAKPHGPA